MSNLSICEGHENLKPGRELNLEDLTDAKAMQEVQLTPGHNTDLGFS